MAIQSRAREKPALPLPGNELEMDPADKEIFKVQLMSKMTHCLGQTKVRLENRKARCKGPVGMRRAEALLSAAGAERLGCDPGFGLALPQALRRGCTTECPEPRWQAIGHAAAVPEALLQPFSCIKYLSSGSSRCCLKMKENSPAFVPFSRPAPLGREQLQRMVTPPKMC